MLDHAPIEHHYVINDKFKIDQVKEYIYYKMMFCDNDILHAKNDVEISYCIGLKNAYYDCVEVIEAHFPNP